MARLIDADKLESGEVIIPTENGGYEYVEVFYKDDVDNALTVDAVEVVRCFQCKYAKVADYEDDQDGYVCQFHKGSIWFSGDFCSQGRRRENG